MMDNVVFRTSLFYRFRVGYKVFLIDNMDTDYCDFVSNNTKSPLLIFVRNRVSAYQLGVSLRQCVLQHTEP